MALNVTLVCRTEGITSNVFFSLGKIHRWTSLSAVGVAALRNTEARTEQPLAMIPLLFGIQQLTKGVI